MQGLRHQLRAVDGHQGGDEGDCGPGHQDLPVDIDQLLQRAILLYCIMYIYIYIYVMNMKYINIYEYQFAHLGFYIFELATQSRSKIRGSGIRGTNFFLFYF